MNVNEKIKIGKRVLMLLSVCALSATGQAEAATGSANLDVSASVAAGCSISTNPVAFGAYDPVGANSGSALDATGSVVVACTNGASSTVTLGQGSNADAGSTDGAPARRMREGGSSNYLTYVLYSDASRTTVWGNTAPTGVGHTGTGSTSTVPVYGRVAAGQNVPAGTYTDVVVATITF